jgi:8-oxo-dGTP pyrophosphatase MutT (NUDIX family)
MNSSGKVYKRSGRIKNQLNDLRSTHPEIQNARINTAGAYVCIGDSYLFAIGIQPHNGKIPVVRLGGHREENETGWQCAAREVYEEANLYIRPLTPQRTYLSGGEHLESELQEMEWQNKLELEPAPCLVVSHRHEGSMILSLMYLARAEEMPTPSSEVKGLLLPTREEIHRLCREPQTLEQFLRSGGTAIMNAKFDESLVLEPFLQLRLLSWILRMHPENEAGFR